MEQLKQLQLSNFQKSKGGDSEAERLHMDHLSGIFLLLSYGIIFSMCYEIFRMIYIVRKRAREYNVSISVSYF